MNILADLYAFQPDDVLEEWRESEPRHLRNVIDDALFEDTIGWNIEVISEPGRYHYHTDNGKKYRIDGRKEMCIECQSNFGGVDTRKSDWTTCHIPHIDDLRAFRPTEDETIRKWYWLNDQGLTGHQTLTKNTDAKEIEKRSAFVKALDKEHRKWLIQFEADLRDTHTMRGLKDMVALGKAHDARLRNEAGRDFTDTLREMRLVFNEVGNRILYASKARMQYQQRQSLAAVVHTQPIAVPISMGIRFPMFMKDSKGGRAIADNAREMQTYIAQGWQCVIR